MLTFHCEQWSVHCLRTHKFHFSATFSLKMGPTALFTYLKKYFAIVFSVSVKISSIQIDPIYEMYLCMYLDIRWMFYLYGLILHDHCSMGVMSILLRGSLDSNYKWLHLRFLTFFFFFWFQLHYLTNSTMNSARMHCS